MEEGADTKGCVCERSTSSSTLGAPFQSLEPEFWRPWELPGVGEPCPHPELPSSGESVNGDRVLRWLVASLSSQRASKVPCSVIHTSNNFFCNELNSGLQKERGGWCPHSYYL